MEEGNAHCVEEQELSYCIHIKRIQIKRSKYAKIVVVKNDKPFLDFK